jgi:uncharacterized protein
MSNHTVSDRSGLESDHLDPLDPLDQQLQAFIGQSAGSPNRAPDAVNQAMIRHWAEAMGDTNPVYVDEEAARRAGFPGVVAPPTMLQAWIMRGLRVSQQVEEARAAGTATGDTPTDRVMSLLDQAGFTSVVATNCDQHYERPLRPGDLIEATSAIESVSPEKQTGLGAGHFVTTRMDYADQHGELVATMRFRILKFRPRVQGNVQADQQDPSGVAGDGTEESAPPPASDRAPASVPPAPASAPPDRPRRPRPSLTQDNRFFFEGTKVGKLLVQRCATCGTLRHPPRPACSNCRSFEWDTVESSGKGTIYSYVVNHHPKVRAFDYPLVVALVELEEGTRIVANVAGITPDTIAIGTEVQASFETFDDELTLPVFHPTEKTGPQNASNEQGGN